MVGYQHIEPIGPS